MSAWLRRRLTANIFARIDCSEERKIEVNGPCFDAHMPLMTLQGGGGLCLSNDSGGGVNWVDIK